MLVIDGKIYMVIVETERMTVDEEDKTPDIYNQTIDDDDELTEELGEKDERNLVRKCAGQQSIKS